MGTWSYLVLFGLFFGFSQAVRLTQPPTASWNAATNTVNGQVLFGSQNPTTGNGIPTQHVVQWRDSTQGQTTWTNLGLPLAYPVSNQQQQSTFFFSLQVPNPGNTYLFRDVLIDQNGFLDTNNVPTVSVNTGGGGNVTPSPTGGPLRMTNPPSAVYNANGQNIRAVITFGANNPVIGNGGTPQSFTLQYRDQTQGGGWQNVVTQPFPNNQNTQRAFTIQNINPGDTYDVRVVLTDNNGRTYNNIQQIPFTRVNTGNIGNIGSGVSSSSPSPFSSSSPNPFSTSSPSPVPQGQCLRLTNPPSATNTGFGQIRSTITLGPGNPVIGRTANRIPTTFIFQYKVQLANGRTGPWTDFGGQRVYPRNSQVNQQFTANVNGLNSGSIYEVRVILLDQFGTRYGCLTVPTTTVGTQCTIPTNTVNVNTVTSTVNTAAATLTARWTFNPQLNSQNCQLRGYGVSYTYNGVTRTDNVPNAVIVFSNYVAGQAIALQIRPRWSGGYGQYSPRVTVPRNVGK